MIFGLALILLGGSAFGGLAKKLRLPPLVGMLTAGILLGPYALNLIPGEVLNLSADLRKIALIVILSRAGLSLDLNDLKRVGRPAVLMCFVPATFEIAATVLLGPSLLPVSRAEAAVMGAVLGAVSPAVIVPKMLKLMDEGYGKARSVPQLILAGASADDIYVVVLFSSFMNLAGGGRFDLASLAKIPLSALAGLAAGVLAGWLLTAFFKIIPLRETVRVLTVLGVAFLLAALEDRIATVVPFSGLLAVPVMGMALFRRSEEKARRISARFSKIWLAAEPVLFVLVGASVNLKVAVQAGPAAAALIFAALAVRVCGVWVCLIQTPLNRKEKLFCALAYLPKATVQAAIGGLPLAAGMAAGNTILTVAVSAILITAPLGAVAMELSYRKLLEKPADSAADSE